MNDANADTVRENYDRIAGEYARHFAGELRHKPFDRNLLDRFSAQVAGRGEVCDLGCGPGHVALYLRDRGVDAFGMDVSPQMIEEARRLHPDVAFREGNMFALDIPNGELAGIVAFYAIVNIPDKRLPEIFSEMRRVLRRDALLLLSFHIGDETVRPQELFGERVSMEFFMFQPRMIVQRLAEAGFWIEEVLEREPYAPEVEYQSRRAYVFARA